MAIDDADERSNGADADEGGEVALYGPSALPVGGMFFRPSVSSNGPMEVDSVERHPMFVCAEEALPAGYGRSDRLVIDDLPYTVRSVLPDGTGMVRLHLERA